MEPLTEHERAVMRKAGLALAMVGAVDIASCVAVVVRGGSYSSSLNVFALIAGILVYRGRDDAARFVVKGLSFLVGGFLLMPLLGLVLAVTLRSFVPPPRLLWLEIRASPFETVGAIALLAAGLALFIWVRNSLGALPLYAGGQPAVPLLRSPATAVGASIPLLLAILFPLLWPSDVGERAVQEARHKVGPGYSFYVRQLNSGPGYGKAVVIAYSAEEMREVPVEWNDK